MYSPAKTIFIFFFFAAIANAKSCPDDSGKYGQSIQYQNMFCRILIGADKIDSNTYRNLTFNNDGVIQVFSNFKGTTNSNSTGARIFYLFPLRTKSEISEVDANHLTVVHPSGAKWSFDKNGKFKSPDLKMNVSKEINSQNNSGVEIESYSKGIVLDFGYKQGGTPLTNLNAIVKITDKKQKGCSLKNSEFHKRNSKNDMEFIHKTNESLYFFLSEKCPQLDLSDLLNPMSEQVKVVKEIKKVGDAPTIEKNAEMIDTNRNQYKSNELDLLIEEIERKSAKGK